MLFETAACIGAGLFMFMLCQVMLGPKTHSQICSTLKKIWMRREEAKTSLGDAFCTFGDFLSDASLSDKVYQTFTYVIVLGLEFVL